MSLTWPDKVSVSENVMSPELKSRQLHLKVIPNCEYSFQFMYVNLLFYGYRYIQIVRYGHKMTQN